LPALPTGQQGRGLEVTCLALPATLPGGPGPGLVGLVTGLVASGGQSGLSERSEYSTAEKIAILSASLGSTLIVDISSLSWVLESKVECLVVKSNVKGFALYTCETLFAQFRRSTVTSTVTSDQFSEFSSR